MCVEFNLDPPPLRLFPSFLPPFFSIFSRVQNAARLISFFPCRTRWLISSFYFKLTTVTEIWMCRHLFFTLLLWRHNSLREYAAAAAAAFEWWSQAPICILWRLQITLQEFHDPYFSSALMFCILKILLQIASLIWPSFTDLLYPLSLWQNSFIAHGTQVSAIKSSLWLYIAELLKWFFLPFFIKLCCPCFRDRGLRQP